MATKYEGTVSHMRDRSDYSTYWQVQEEFDTMAEAKAFVLAQHEESTACGGKVITWAVYPNLPHCLPAMRYSSCALETYEGGEWNGHYIHG